MKRLNMKITVEAIIKTAISYFFPYYLQLVTLTYLQITILMEIVKS